MAKILLRTALTATVVAILGSAGCEDKEVTQTAISPTPAATASNPTPPEPPVAPAQVPATMTVSSVDLGNSIGADRRVMASLASFARIDPIHASVVTDGASGGKLTAKWTREDGQVIETQDKLVPAGPQVTAFSTTKSKRWSVGTYALQLSTDGHVVQTRAFKVQ